MPATKARVAHKFADCRDCAHAGTWRCVRCTAGEFFEERSAAELDALFDFIEEPEDD